jgi:hypothetical protein
MRASRRGPSISSEPSIPEYTLELKVKDAA